MHNDELPNDALMDQLLTDAMRAERPQLSPGFDAAVMRRVRPRRLSRMGRIVMTSYAATAVAVTCWFVRDVPVIEVAGGLVVAAIVALLTMAYTRRLVPQD